MNFLLPMRHLVHNVLRKPLFYDWDVQGFGMLRAYLDREHRFRLNIWDASLQVPGVSVIHDHPWDFSSVILQGVFHNVRYVEIPASTHSWAEEYCYHTIVPGPDGGPTSILGPSLGNEYSRMFLHAQPIERYLPGMVYQQKAKEIHASYFGGGAVTLNDRIRPPGPDEARVFWLAGGKWVDAKPRPAEFSEIRDVTARALEQWEYPRFEEE